MKNIHMRLSAVLTALLMTLGLSLVAAPAQAASCVDGSLGCTSVMNAISSTCNIEAKTGTTVTSLTPSHGKIYPKGATVYWRFTDSACKVSSVSPQGIYTIPSVNQWRQVMAASSTIITIKR